MHHHADKTMTRFLFQILYRIAFSVKAQTISGAVPIKRLHLCILLFVLAGSVQSTEKIQIRLKNNGWRPHEFKFLERHPDVKGPNVFTVYLLPGQTHTVALRVGTTLSKVNQQEINATMKGLKVTGKVLLVVKPDDNGKLIRLNP